MHNKNSAMAFIVLLGIVSLFSDMTHEAATSIKGAYLLILGEVLLPSVLSPA